MSRQEFSSEVKRDALKRSGGICECHLLAQYGIPGFTAEGCGQPVGPAGNIFYEHIIVDRAGGRPTLDNAAVLTKTCWKKKTADYDQGRAAKTRHLEDMANGIRARERRGRPMAGTRASGLRKRMDGTVERRT